MVGGQGGAGRRPAELTEAELAEAELTEAEPAPAGPAADMRSAYGAAAAGWAAGPAQLYAPLARALIAAAPVPVAGRRVLDLGAGTGVAARAALAAGAGRVVAADLAEAMLRCAGPLQDPVVADAAALPFRDRAFDLVVAAFCLNHLDRPGEVLRELRRVGRGLAASTFEPGWTHPAKLAVDEALRSFGFQPPAWYASMKRDAGPDALDRPRLRALAAGAGFTDVRVDALTVPTGLSTPAQLASWRLGLAHIAPFVQSLDTARRAAAWRAAEQAVAGTGPLVVSMLVLAAR
ncbi:MAG TPA: methyltransferase domain-containing protein [Streptosporangiaceae bacterium]